MLRAMNPPTRLGRSIVVAPGVVPPAPWDRATRVAITPDLLGNAPRLAEVVDRLHRAWVSREPLVIEMGIDPAVLREPELTTMDPWRLRRDFAFNRERLHHLVWANSYDFRSGEPIWWWSRKAEAAGAAPSPTADITLPDGRPAWVDGGPRGPVGGLTEPIVAAESVTIGSLRPVPPPGTGALAGLAPDQKAAAGHASGPARIVAPAGSGKTRTLVARIRHLIADRGVEPEIVCALAYNNRAAAEMRERLGAPPGLKIRTIHSLGWEILRDARGNLTLLEERDQRRRLDGIVAAPRRPSTDVIGPYLEALGEVRIALRSPDEVEAFRDDVPDFARVCTRYRTVLRDRGEADFDEQIYGAIEALLALPQLRHRWQDRCRHMVVDEFQDLTPAYLLLIRLLAAPELDVFGVGDDDQVIYGYLGADPGYLIEYDRLFPGSASHPLEVNYRCPPAVVSAASNLLSYNQRRVDKTIRAAARGDEEGSMVVARAAGTELALDAAVRIGEWLPRTPAGEIAVLSRVNTALLPVHVALAEAGIPFRSPLGTEVLDRTALAAALAWLRVGQHPEQIATADLMKVVRRPARGLTRVTSQLVGRRRRVARSELARLGEALDGKQATKWSAFLGDIDRVVAAASRGDSLATLDVIVGQIGLAGAAAALDAGRRRADRSAQSDDLVALRRAAVLHRDLEDFETWLRGSLQQEADTAGVELSTVHRVKGMEWSRVVVFGADRGLLPHALAEDIEEERRVFHVAITRGREQVVVLADAARPSPFLDELARVRSAPAPAPPPERGTGIVVAAGERVRIAGGYSGVVEGFEEGGALVALDSGTGTLLVPWGEAVTTPAGRGSLSPPRQEPVADEDLVTRLKSWRRDVSAANGVPAYIIMNDRTLLAIAAARPTTERGLIMIPGIGPAKLEAYGDEILAICAADPD
jgi:DNA helicase-2/ATP-dependent DNA helicase PcrA